MKREGRQHGLVRTYPILSAPWNPRPNPGRPTTSTLTAGLFTKVSTKPTNHSKFTGKCGRAKCRDCHITPASKSKDKAKGAHRLRSSSDYRLITLRVVDDKPGLKLSGFSATGVLDYLDDHSFDSEEYNYGEVEGLNDGEIQHPLIENEGNDDEDEDEDGMGFCEVDFVWEVEDGDEDWCLV